MTPKILQDALAEELAELFKDEKYQDSLGDPVPLHIFKQSLPKILSEDDEDPDPFIIVRVEEWSQEEQTEPIDVTVRLIVELRDDAADNQGHVRVMHIIQTVYERFMENPVLGGQFVFREPFTAVLQEEESDPYFVGACQLHFAAYAARRKGSIYT